MKCPLCGRDLSYNSIKPHLQSHTLGRAWTPEQINYLKKHYLDKDKKVETIARKLSRSIYSVKSMARRLKITGKYKGIGNLNHPILKPSPALSYIIGVLYGDGCVYKERKNNGWGYAINLGVKNRNFALAFKKACEEIGLYAWMRKDKKGIWTVRAYSKLFYDWYTTQSHKKVIFQYPYEFVRGFYDSEGCWAHIGKGKHRIQISNTNKKYVDTVAQILNHLGVQANIYKNYRKHINKWEYKIVIHGFERVKKFLKIIKPVVLHYHHYGGD